MKKKWMLSLILSVALATGAALAAPLTMTSIRVALNSVSIVVNGKTIDQPNIVYNGTTYVPINAVASELGAQVSWDGDTRTVTIQGGGSESAGQVTPQVPVPSAGTPDPKAKGKKPAVTVEQLPYTITIREPDSIGTVYMDATVTNNSQYTVGSVSFTVLLKDQNDKTYLSTHDTLLPGETSPKFDSFGPKTRNMSDIQILEINYTLLDKDGKKTYIDYDAKTGIYKVL